MPLPIYTYMYIYHDKRLTFVILHMTHKQVLQNERKHLMCFCASCRDSLIAIDIEYWWPKNRLKGGPQTTDGVLHDRSMLVLARP